MVQHAKVPWAPHACSVPRARCARSVGRNDERTTCTDCVRNIRRDRVPASVGSEDPLSAAWRRERRDGGLWPFGGLAAPVLLSNRLRKRSSRAKLLSCFCATRILQARRVFQAIDQDHSGFISLEDFLTVFLFLPLHSSQTGTANTPLHLISPTILVPSRAPNSVRSPRDSPTSFCCSAQLLSSSSFLRGSPPLPCLPADPTRTESDPVPRRRSAARRPPRWSWTSSSPWTWTPPRPSTSWRPTSGTRRSRTAPFAATRRDGSGADGGGSR